MITFFKNLMANGFVANAGLALFAILALAAAYTAQYGFGMEPCILCLTQRVPYAVIAVLGLIGAVLAHKNHPKAAAATVFLIGIAFIAQAGIAFYHAGVEQHWWKSFIEGCAVPDMSGDSTNLLQQIEAAKAVPCDVIPWSMFGISMAGYNAIVSAIAAPLSLLSSLLIVRKANGL